MRRATDLDGTDWSAWFGLGTVLYKARGQIARRLDELARRTGAGSAQFHGPQANLDD